MRYEAATGILVFLGLLSGISCTPRQYNAYQISGGLGGQASAESIAAFPGALNSLSGTALSDVNTEAHCAVLAEAEFISQISAAGSNTATGKALAVGMIKNKVLKIYSTLQAVDSQIATRGNSASLAAQQTDLQTKLQTNIALDEGSNGQTSQGVDFTCP